MDDTTAFWRETPIIPGGSSFGSPNSRPGLCTMLPTSVRCGSSAVLGSAEPVKTLAVPPIPAVGRQFFLSVF